MSEAQQVIVTADIARQAVEEAESTGKSISTIAEEMGLNPKNLYNAISRAKKGGLDKKAKGRRGRRPTMPTKEQDLKPQRPNDDKQINPNDIALSEVENILNALNECVTVSQSSHALFGLGIAFSIIKQRRDELTRIAIEADMAVLKEAKDLVSAISSSVS